MTSLNDTTPITTHAAEAWGSSRETHPAIVMAIYAIADSTRTPDQIWEAPTRAEMDHVVMAVESYIAAGIFDPNEDGQYCWGCETLEIA